MATESDHISLANRNHAALLCLLREENAAHPEWIATISFYKAVHIVEAVFATRHSRHSNCHDTRLSELKHPDFSDLFKAYRPLYVASLVARYLEASGARYKSFSDYMTLDSVKKTLLLRRLRAVEEQSIRFLTPSGAASLQRIANAGIAVAATE